MSAAFSMSDIAAIRLSDDIAVAAALAPIGPNPAPSNATIQRKCRSDLTNISGC